VTLRVDCVVLHCDDPAALAPFWREALGYGVVYDGPFGVLLGDLDREGTRLGLLRGEPQGSAMHLDLRPDDQAAEVARLVALGATRVDVGQPDDATWVVLADPAGNAFCVLRDLRP